MAVEENLIPEWIKKKQVEFALEEAQVEARLQRQLAAKLFVQSESPRFWERLVDKLKIAVDALPVLKIEGSLNKDSDRHVRIFMRMPGIFPNETYTNLFLDDQRIRATTLDDGSYTLDFIIPRENCLSVMTTGEGITMSPDRAHEYIMSRMILLLERRRGQCRPC